MLIEESGMGHISRKSLAAWSLVACCLSSCVGRSVHSAGALPTATPSASPNWMEDFNLSARKLASSGQSKYFILTPGYQLNLASSDTKLTVTVLNDTKEIGGITTRVIEEREQEDGALSEISRNFYAIDPDTGDVFYFGEEVDYYSQGQLTGHGGAWLAYDNGSRPGLIMPGTPTVGMKYYQELAPGTAEDRAMVVSTTEIISSGAGDFRDCVRTQESSKIEPGVLEYKVYCPGIGLVQDESLTLESYQTATITSP